jgi:hypothetical protein
MQTNPTYRHYESSGKVSWRAPFSVIMKALPLSALFAAVYAVVVHYNPIIYFTVVATLVFGVCVGMAAQASAEKGNSRNRRFDVAAALFAAIFALWFHWLVWTAIKMPQGAALAGRMATSGARAWLAFLDDLSIHRELSITRGGAHGALSPTTMIVLWIVEGVLVVLAAIGAAFVCHGKQAFSERTQKWSKTDANGELRLKNGDFAEVLPAISKVGLSWLQGLLLDKEPQSTPVDGYNLLKVTCVSEPSDPDFRFVTITGATRKPRPKGRPVTQHQADICTLLHADATDYDALVARLRK